MKTPIICCVVAIAAFCVIDVAVGAERHEETSHPSRKELVERLHRKKTGGTIKRPGTQKGSVAFFNAITDRVSLESLSDLAAELEKTILISVRNEKIDSCPDKNIRDIMKAKNANAAVFIVWRDDCDVPMLFAPEQHWAIVNAKTLVEDNPGEAAFRTRLTKEATRAFAYVCGSGGSNGGGDLMDAKDVKALDDVQAELPFDIQARFETHLRDMGITPWEETTYLRACQEGWAPPPTNAIQRAIWEKVHQIPDKPIKIEFDPKKDK